MPGVPVADCGAQAAAPHFDVLKTFCGGNKSEN
jgi:hypothetical protein